MAYNFNGSNQYLNTTSSPVGNSLAPITMACLVKGNPANAAYWLALGRSTNSAPIVGMTVGSGGVARMFVRADSGVAVDSSGTTAIFGPSTGWAHTAFTNTSSARNLYVNGVNEATGGGNNFAVTLDRLGIGALIRNSVSSYFGGDIAECGIWNAELTAAEIASLADGMTCDKVRPQSLVFYAPLVRDLQDVRGGLTITNNNTATVANHPRVYA
jgi:hypothetical protein